MGECMSDILKGMIELKISDCSNELERLENEYHFINLTEEDRLSIELRKEYLKGKITALKQVLELMEISV